MTRRRKLILTRPFDESLEAFISYRNNTVIRSTNSRKIIFKEDLVSDWEKFWRSINERTDRRMCTDRSIN